MHLEININNIKQIALEKRNENSLFHSFLKQQDSNKVDEIVNRLDLEITPQIDCLECGNCCNNLRPIASNEVLRQFVEEKNIEEFKYLMSFSCKNLDGKKCTIYLDRPDECRLFPYMDRKDFVSRILGVLQNYEICPIVFNIFEQLKTELKWQYK